MVLQEDHDNSSLHTPLLRARSSPPQEPSHSSSSSTTTPNSPYNHHHEHLKAEVTGPNDNNNNINNSEIDIIDSREASCFGLFRIRGINHNVYWTYWLLMLWGLSDSIWSNTLIVNFVYRLTNNSNQKVGYMEGVQGVASLLSAIPVGYYADTVSEGVSLYIYMYCVFCYLFNIRWIYIFIYKSYLLEIIIIKLLYTTYLLCHNRYRDNLLFVLGVSDSFLRPL